MRPSRAHTTRVSLSWFALVFVAAACDSAPEAPQEEWVAADNPFCQSVIPAVKSFVMQARTDFPTPSDERYGGIVTVAGGPELDGGMNPVATTTLEPLMHQQFVNLMTLIDYDENAAPRPYLAESWEIAEDGTSITFRLRDDVRWHDGERTDAHDVAFTYRALSNPLAEYANAAYWDPYVGGDEAVEVVDDFTVRFTTTPHTEPLDAWRAVGILPEHLLGDVPPDELRGHPYGMMCPVGNGPFVFFERVGQQRWVFVANPAFPEALGGRPYVDRYVYRVVPDANTMGLELTSGAVEVALNTAPARAAATVADDDLNLVAHAGRGVAFIAWNARRPPLSDVRVRRALTMGIDRDALVESVVEGYGSVAHSLVPPFHWAYAEGVGRVPHDRVEARRLLDEAGYVDADGDGWREDGGERFTVEVQIASQSTTQIQMATIAQAQLRDIGVELELNILDVQQLVANVTSPDRPFQGAFLQWITDFKIDDSGLLHSRSSEEPYAFSGTQNPELDAVLVQLQETLDRDEARPIWRRYQELLGEVQPYTFFYFPDRMSGVNKRVNGVVMDARGDLVNVREWWLDPASR